MKNSEDSGRYGGESPRIKTKCQSTKRDRRERKHRKPTRRVFLILYISCSHFASGHWGSVSFLFSVLRFPSLLYLELSRVLRLRSFFSSRDAQLFHTSFSMFSHKRTIKLTYLTIDRASRFFSALFFFFSPTTSLLQRRAFLVALSLM